MVVRRNDIARSGTGRFRLVRYGSKTSPWTTSSPTTDGLDRESNTLRADGRGRLLRVDGRLLVEGEPHLRILRGRLLAEIEPLLDPDSP